MNAKASREAIGELTMKLNWKRRFAAWVKPNHWYLLRFEIMRRVAAIIFPGYRFKWPQMAWWNDPMFNAYLDRFGERRGMNTDRRWMLYQLRRLVAHVPGDTAECGVWKGAGSYLICALNARESGAKRRHHVFDSFEGLSAPSEEDGFHWSRGDLSCPITQVKNNLIEFAEVELHQGWIPDRFVDVKNKLFAFVHIDVDLLQPTMDSLRFFYDRMSPAGIIVCDDYGLTSCPGATRACDEFLVDKPEKMISLCSGGGYIVKGCVTAEPLRE